jgi:hypothetical protein
MKLIIQDNRIAGTATDSYNEPGASIDAPEGFDINRMGEYEYVDGMVAIPAPGIPQSVTMRQARLALLQGGLLQSITDNIAAGTDEPMKIEWSYATTVDRDWTSLVALATSMGLTDTQLDDLFVLAATL